MKIFQAAMKCYLSENYALKISVITSFVLMMLGANFCYSQTNKSLNKSYYHMVLDMISKDTIVSDIQMVALENGIKTGKYIKEDSIGFSRLIKEKELRLYKYTINESLEAYLRCEVFKDNSSVVSYLGQERLFDLVKSIPIDAAHCQMQLDSTITIFDKKLPSSLGHFFSSPLHLESNRYLCLHIDKNNSNDGEIKLILFKVEEDEDYRIEKEIGLSTCR